MVTVVREDNRQQTVDIPEIVREEEMGGPGLTAGPMVASPRQAERAAARRSEPSGAYGFEESSEIPSTSVIEHVEAGAPGAGPDTGRSDELEALWPGVHHEFLQPVKRTPAFYAGIGFAAGVVVTLFSMGGFSLVSNHIAARQQAGNKEIVVAGASQQGQQLDESTLPKNVDPHSVIVPISSSYEVKSGDTLAMIAIKNYHKVTPRLIDEIVASNDLKSANVLKLGQKLKLPTYRTQSSKIAASKSSQVN